MAIIGTVSAIVLICLLLILALGCHSTDKNNDAMNAKYAKKELEETKKKLKNTTDRYYEDAFNARDTILRLEREIESLNKLIYMPKYKVSEVVYFRNGDKIVSGVIIGFAEFITTDLEEGTLKTRRVNSIKYKIEMWEKKPTFSDNILLTVVPEEDITSKIGEEII